LSLIHSSTLYLTQFPTSQKASVEFRTGRTTAKATPLIIILFLVLPILCRIHHPGIDLRGKIAARTIIRPAQEPDRALNIALDNRPFPALFFDIGGDVGSQFGPPPG